MSTDYIDLLRNSLQHALSAQIDSAAAFEELALAGERLRAAVPDWLGEADEASRLLLDRYDSKLRASRAHALTDLSERLDAALDRLEACAGHQGESEVELQEMSVAAVDEVLQLALAAHRVDALEAQAVSAMAVRARQRAAMIAPRLLEMCERSASWGADHLPPPEFPELYGHRRALAELSCAALQLADHVSHLVRRQQVVDAVAATFDPTRLVQRSGGLGARLRVLSGQANAPIRQGRAADRYGFESVPFERSKLAAATAATSLPRENWRFRVEGFQIVSYPGELVFTVDATHVMEPIEARVVGDTDTAMRFETVSEGLVRVGLGELTPPFQLVVTLRLDGELVTFELPIVVA